MEWTKESERVLGLAFGYGEQALFLDSAPGDDDYSNAAVVNRVEYLRALLGRYEQVPKRKTFDAVAFLAASGSDQPAEEPAQSPEAS